MSSALWAAEIVRVERRTVAVSSRFMVQTGDAGAADFHAMAQWNASRSESSPPVARFSTRVREGKNPDGAGKIGVVDDKWKPLHDEPPRAVLLKRVALRIGLNRLDRL